MAKIWFGHFDSTEDDERSMLASDWSKYIKSFITDGIRNGGTCLEITKGEGLKLNMHSGVANIQGYIFVSERDENGEFTEIRIDTPHNQYDRIDRVVLRLDRNTEKRTIEPVVIRGVASENPALPSITRDGLIYEISLAQVRVKANSIQILSEYITDERFNTEVCGLINSVLGVESSHWQRKFDEFIERVKLTSDTKVNDIITNNQTKFDEMYNKNKSDISLWFNSVKFDISKLQHIDFDNLISLKGTTKTILFSEDGSIFETLKIINSDFKVAEKLTSFLDNGGIVENMKIYEKDGISLLNEMTKTTVFNADGSITEEVV